MTTSCGPFIRVTFICETLIHMCDMDSHVWHTTCIGDEKLQPIHAHTCDIDMWDTDLYVWHGFICVTCHMHRWRQIAAHPYVLHSYARHRFIRGTWIYIFDIPHTQVTSCGPFIRVTFICETLIHMCDMDSHVWHATHIGDDKLRLKGYQLVGLNWLRMLHETDVNGILAVHNNISTISM